MDEFWELDPLAKQREDERIAKKKEQQEQVAARRQARFEEMQDLKLASYREGPFVIRVRKWMDETDEPWQKPYSAAELYHALEPYDIQPGNAWGGDRWFRSPLALARHVSALPDEILQELGLSIQKQYLAGKSRTRNIYLFDTGAE